MDGKGWTPARELKAGDQLLTVNKSKLAVENVFETGDTETVYNFRVADWHTYFVGSQDWDFEVWVHNACGAGGQPPLAKGPSGFEPHGFNPPPGTRQIPEGIPETWRIRPTQGEGGVWYFDPTNKGNAVRVMPGNPTSPFPNSQAPYVRWQKNGQPLDSSGNILPTKKSPDAHIPLPNFIFKPELFK